VQDAGTAFLNALPFNGLMTIDQLIRR
jgi:hypothetical protein